MASALSTNPFAMEGPHETPASGATASAEVERSSELQRSAGSFESYDTNGDGMRMEGSADEFQPDLQKPANPSELLSSLDSVYFQEPEAPAPRPASESPAASTSDAAAATSEEECVACVLWELEHLPISGDLMANVVARLEKLKTHGDEVNRSLCCRVAERREELTKAASVLGHLRQALQKLRSESAAVRAGLSAFRQECVLPSLAITKQQQTKLALEREMQELLQIQRVEALLMAAENSCVNRELPLQAALLVEGAALSFDPQGSQAFSASQRGEPGGSTHPSLQGGIKRMQQMLENLKTELNAALQAAARSLPPPPCSCGWRQPEPVSYSSRRGLQRSRAGSGVATTAAAGSAEDTWPQYYSALAAFSLLPPSSSVGASVAAAVAAAAAAATRQVLCAFVPADAAAFSEAESESFDAQRLSARLRLHDNQHPAAGAADAVAALPSAENLAASVAAADASACFMTLLGVQYDILLGAAALMRWHAAEALRLLAEVKAESSECLKKRSQAGISETEMLELLGGGGARGCTYTSAGRTRDRSDPDAPQRETQFVDTYELAALATQRLKGLPSSLRLALFLLQVRKQFLSQRGSLWQQLQQQTAQVLQHLDLGGGGPTAVGDCISLMQAVRAFAVLGESFVASENAEAEAALATEAAAAAAAVAATRAPADLLSSSFDAAADADSAAAAAIAADAAAAAATAAAAAAAPGEAVSGAQCTSKEPSAGRLSQVLVARVQEAIACLQETHTQELLQQVKAETWERLPVLRRYPLVLLRAPRQLGVLPQQLSEGMHPFAVAAEGGAVAAQAGRGRNLCGCCGEALRLSTVPNPFARWQPGAPFAGTELKTIHQARGDSNASVELAAIEEELKAAEACGRGSDEPPVAVGASQAAAQCVMQYWQLAVCAPEVGVPAVKAMIQVVGFYLAAVAASALPEDICSCLATPLKHSFPSFGETRDKLKTTGSADAAVLRNRLPHLHWLLCQTDEDLRASRKKLLRSRSGEGGSSNTAAASRPVLTELIRPMARMASPGALWGLAERVAAVESARDLLEALTQQLHVQGLPQHFGSREGTRVLRQQREPAAGRDESSGLLRCLPREEQQQLWRLLAATRCAADDLRALVYRVAAGSLCQSSAFLSSFHQAVTECSSERVVRNGSRALGVSTSGANVLPRAHAAAVQQHRRQVADLFWKIRCAGSGSIPVSVQPLIWRAVKSQAVADALDALSAVPLAVDAAERCLSPGPLVALAEALREIIAEAEAQYRKALAAAGYPGAAPNAAGYDRGGARAPRDGTTLERHGTTELFSLSPLNYSEADFDSFLDVCSRTAPEVMLWCKEQQKRALSFQPDASSKTLPLRVMPQMLQRLENAGLIPKGQTAEFENKQSALLMQLMQPPPPPS